MQAKKLMHNLACRCEKRACNFHSDCTVGKILIEIATNVWAGPNGSSPVNATLVLVEGLGESY